MNNLRATLKIAPLPRATKMKEYYHLSHLWLIESRVVECLISGGPTYWFNRGFLLPCSVLGRACVQLTIVSKRPSPRLFSAEQAVRVPPILPIFGGPRDGSITY